MKIRIYQINPERDTDGRMFMNLARLEKNQHTRTPDSTLYDRVFEGEVKVTSLEDVFYVFNMEYPAGYIGRSLSVSDVVEIVDGGKEEPGFYFCDSFGFQKVAFDDSLAQVKEGRTITVVLLEPGELARVKQIDGTLAGMQRTVGGYIEAVCPFEESVCLVCNEEGKINGLPLNRAISTDGQIVDIIAGPCFLCDCSGENFGSLSPEQQKRYTKQFLYPERFLKINGRITAVPYNPAPRGKER